MASKREDGRGHWPRGKRRHADRGNWSRLRLALTRVLEAEHRPGEISASQLARDLAVSPRTVLRWLHGEDRPSEECQEAIEGWLAEWREELKRRTGANPTTARTNDA